MPRPSKRDIPFAVIERMMKRYGAKRVSDGSVVAVQSAVEQYLHKVVSLAVDSSLYAGKKTLQEIDVQQALKIQGEVHK